MTDWNDYIFQNILKENLSSWVNTKFDMIDHVDELAIVQSLRMTPDCRNLGDRKFTYPIRFKTMDVNDRINNYLDLYQINDKQTE